MDLTTLEDPSDLKDHHLDVGNHLVKGLQGWWRGVVERKFSNLPQIIKFYENYINSNGIAYGHGCGD